MTAKTRNPDRKSGKAWGRGHTPTVKVLTPEQQERKAEKEARRGKRVVGQDRGSNITMPKFTWDWAAEAMGGGRITSTHKFRMVDACLARGGRGSDEIEVNPEAKPSRKNGR